MIVFEQTSVILRGTNFTELPYATILQVSLVLLVKLFSGNQFLAESKSSFLFLFIKIMQNYPLFLADVLIIHTDKMNDFSKIFQLCILCKLFTLTTQ